MIEVVPAIDTLPPAGAKVASTLLGHFWSCVHDGATALLEQCVRIKVPSDGFGSAHLYLDDWLFAYIVKVIAKPRRLGPNTNWATYNIYTREGLIINDNRWRIPFQPPTRSVRRGNILRSIPLAPGRLE